MQKPPEQKFPEKIFLPISSLAGVGEKLSGFLSRLVEGKRVLDLLYHFPTHSNLKKFLPSLHKVQNKDLIIAKVKVESHIKPINNRGPLKVRCYSSSGYLNLVFFKTFPNYIERNFPINAEIVVSGVVEKFGLELQMSHPDYVFPADKIDKIPKNEIIYPSIGAFSQKFLRGKISQALTCLKDFPDNIEWIDQNLMKQENWQSWKESIFNLHNSEHNLPQTRRRLAFDEILATQIASQIAKKYLKAKNGRALNVSENLREKLLSSLSFDLTCGQKEVLRQIDQDLTSNKKMLRLLQGDVGSGKTIVALLAMLLAVSNKKQAAIICPITLLAFQHYRSFEKITNEIGIKIALLTSKTTKKNKQKILDDLASGQIDILIGTHSLIEPDVVFKDLAIAVIDEQHRFGVVQRMKLSEKGSQVDVLLMSATPIPRSLMMTFYGDMDISSLSEKPKNRLSIDTRVISQNKEDQVLGAISRALKNGDKIYWICPLIEESEENPQPEGGLNNVTDRFTQFQKLFGKEKVDLIHGKMKEKEKDQIMNNFISGQTQVLVATTVIEVGIDVSDATVIVIENPENFGLSALHQLRGRVGRGEKQSFCILLYGKRLGENGKKRLSIMKNSNDGFFIAEEDLKLRGSGQMIGTKQSGLTTYKIANLDSDLDLIKIAHRQAQYLLEKDLSDSEKEKIKTLLKIFNYHECFKLLFGG
ncbi:MAG: ATP-dependent DNA helicase RecG [Myxococcota bacterium]|jgi:ATP-dependent DNA helicase RecG